MMLQLPLNISLPQGRCFENYYGGCNTVAVEQFIRGIEIDNEPFIYLYGHPGVGKTHLLLAACDKLGNDTRPVSYICLREYKNLGPEMVEGMSKMNLLCLDNIDEIAGNEQWEKALFNLYNTLREANIPLIVSARFAPNASEFALPDLVSRLNWGLSIRLLDLSDSEKIIALQGQAMNKGLHLPLEVGQYLLKRCPRDMHALFDILNKLDYASLASQRKLTIPFVRTLLDA